MDTQISLKEMMEYHKEMIQKHEDTRDAFRKIGRDISIKSIENIRKWVFEVLTISSAILGVFIAIGGNSPMVKHSELLPYAFACFVFTIIYGFYRLKKDMEKDLDKTPKLIGELCESQTKIINAEKEFYCERTEKAYEKMEQIRKEELGKQGPRESEKEKRSYCFDIIFSIFFFGLILIGYSIQYIFGNILLVAFVAFLAELGFLEYKHYSSYGKKQT
ncbi:MAG: hypothetical protein HQ593_00240 [Candidatus Omnitrophica bacterium]|nr:hypothetical protein [Candidatus Omnitrophota bacterium]